MSDETPLPKRLCAAALWLAGGVWMLPYVYYLCRFIPPEYCAGSFEGAGYYAWCLLQLALTVGLFVLAVKEVRAKPGAGASVAAVGLVLLLLVALLAFVDDQWRAKALGVAHRRLGMHRQDDPLSDLFFHWRSAWHAGLVLFAFGALMKGLARRAPTDAARRESLARLGLVVAPLVLVGVGLEAAARVGVFGEPLAVYKGGTEVYRLNLLLGWSHREHTVSELVSPEFRVPVQINSAGLRDPEHTVAKQPGRKRILCLGDSFTFGAGVAERQRFGDLLGSKLLSGVEVINSGVTGYGTDQEYLYLTRQGFRYEPDVVVLAFCCRNDFEDNTREGGLGYPKPRFELEGGQLRLLSFVSPDRQTYGDNPEPFSFRRHVRAYQYLARRLYMIRETRRLSDRAKSAAPDRESRPRPRFDEPEDDLAWLQTDRYAVRPRGFEVTCALAAAIRDECHGRGVPLIVLLIPPAELLQRAPEPMTGLWSHLARSHRAGRDMCASLGVPWTDTLAAEREAARAGEKLRYRKDGHWTPRGHEIAAEVLMRTIREAELLPARCFLVVDDSPS